MGALTGSGALGFFQLIHIGSDRDGSVLVGDRGFRIVCRSHRIGQRGSQPDGNVPCVRLHDSGIFQFGQKRVEVILQRGYLAGGACRLVFHPAANPARFRAFFHNELSSDNKGIPAIVEVVFWYMRTHDLSLPYLKSGTAIRQPRS